MRRVVMFGMLAIAAGSSPRVSGERNPSKSVAVVKATTGLVARAAPRGSESDRKLKDVWYVAGGTPATVGAWPSAVALAYLNQNGGYSQYCGGSLIGTRTVLTAAHCEVTVGDVAWVGRTDLDDTTQGEQRQVVGVRIHDKFDANTLENDVAIVTLSRSVPFPAVTLSTTAADTTAGTTSVAIGWGRTKGDGPKSLWLLEADFPVQPQIPCRDAYFGIQRKVTDSMLCAGSSDYAKDTCGGDSGGPLFKKDGDKLIQIGITSYGYGCGRPGFFGIYTKVLAHADWIASHGH